MHQVADEFQHCAQFTRWMQCAEVERGEAPAFQQCDHQRIAERELHHRRGSRGEVVRTGLARFRQRQHYIGGGTEGGIRFRGHGDQADTEAARIVDEVLEFSRLAGPRQRKDHIVGGDHAEIAMAGFGSMNEERRRASGSEGRCHLLADVAGLAETGDDEASLGVTHEFDSRIERAAEVRLQRVHQRGDAAGFRVEGAERGCDRRRCVAGRGRGRCPRC